MKIPLLITSSVYVSSSLMEIKDSDRRIELTLAAIKEWIRIDPELEIVICDGSGFDYKPYVSRDFPNAKIECLNFINNTEMIKIHGKGYGEGENVNYGITNSELIKKGNYFAKCTSKYWVENYEECVKGFNSNFSCEKSYKIRTLNKYVQCQTIFYISEIEFYKKYFASCYMRVDDFNDYFLENVFGDVIRENKIKHITFKHQPLVYGLCGSSGDFYNTNLESLIGKLFRWIRYLFY